MILDANDGWREQVSRQGFAEGQPSDLTSLYFSLPWMWNRFYRASKDPFSTLPEESPVLKAGPDSYRYQMGTVSSIQINRGGDCDALQRREGPTTH